MTKDTKLSQDTFEKLITRASEIDEDGAQRIDVARAREIALELGISAEAWDAAVRERGAAITSPVPRPLAQTVTSERLLVSAARVGISGVVGFNAGLLMANMSADVLTGAFALLVSLALVLVFRNRPKGVTLAAMAAFWTALPIGIMLGVNEFLTDPLWFAMWSWIACAALTLSLPRLIGLLRRLRSRLEPTTPTA